MVLLIGPSLLGWAQRVYFSPEVLDLRTSLLHWACILTLSVAATFSHESAWAAEFPIHKFQSGGGRNPTAGLLIDSLGNLYGTTIGGGPFSDGIVFEMSPTSGGGWTYKNLHVFNGTDGAYPSATLIFDSEGNLYGTTSLGGKKNNGIVFELTPTQDGTWSESVIYEFTTGGASPQSSLVFDNSGNLYGTTFAGGSSGRGEVFELQRNGDGSWTEIVLHSFSGSAFGDGANPQAGIVFDSVGNIYGTTRGGGTGTACSGGCGIVYELTPSSGSWIETILHSLAGGGSDGAYPTSSLVFDVAGNLFGTTFAGGIANGGEAGTVFTLVNSAGQWTESLIHNFQVKSDGKNPDSGIVFDPNGNIFGATYGGGTYGQGTLFKLAQGSPGKWAEVEQYSFGKAGDGQLPEGNLIFGSLGNLFGVTYRGGAGYGTVYKFRP